MLDNLINIRNMLAGFLREEWFWAIIAIIVTLLSFIIQMQKENEISRANFVYNISNDFANNDRILRVYQWLEKCRRANSKVTSYPALHIATDAGVYDEDRSEDTLDFIDIDTYVNHFEAVYVILRSVNIKNIDELFQQRFLSFMFNPYIQKEELFACFGPDANDFLLLKEWLTSIDRRNRFSCEAFIDYLSTYTCGTYEFSKNSLVSTKKHWPLLYSQKIKEYLLNYVYYICDPDCQYGYYRFYKNKGTPAEEFKILRIIRSGKSDKHSILDLQQRVISSMENPEWYSPSTEAEIQAALENPQDYSCIQVCSGDRVVAFSFAIINPTQHQDIILDLKEQGHPYAKQGQCILDTIFVDPNYRGFGIQKVLINILCSWAATLGKRNISATVHPDNHFSGDNFLKNGFTLITKAPIAKYGSHRNVFTKKLSSKDICKSHNGSYVIYPYA